MARRFLCSIIINLKNSLNKLQMLAFCADICYYVIVRTNKKIQTTERGAETAEKVKAYYNNDNVA